jgi:hypothetical protein
VIGVDLKQISTSVDGAATITINRADVLNALGEHRS